MPFTIPFEKKGKGLMDFVWISLGAIIGANLRYLVNLLCFRYLSPILPLGTLIVNVTGSFILGFFLIWAFEKVAIGAHWRLFVAVGFCGAYTTFSSFSYETYLLIEQSAYGVAVINFICNNLFSLLAVIAGVLVARAL